MSGIEYRDGNIEAIYHAEGRAHLPLGAEVWIYEYSIRDHLGNTRLTFNDQNANGIVDVPEDILQEQHYYPFGMSSTFNWMNDAGLDDTKYLYNGKELSGEYGLNWADYGARWYDFGVSRWWSVDDASDEPSQLGFSPYNYAWNNPINMTDPDGRFPIETIWDVGNVLYDIGKIVYGAATDNPSMVASGTKDLLADGAATLTPYVPAGSTKILKAVGEVASTTKGINAATEVAEVVAKSEDKVEPYSRIEHYGRTPTAKDRKDLGASKDEVVDHDPPLIKRYYEGDPKKGEKPGNQMTKEERKQSANDRSRMKLQSKDESNKQGAEMSRYSRDQKEKIKN